MIKHLNRHKIKTYINLYETHIWQPPFKLILNNNKIHIKMWLTFYKKQKVNLHLKIVVND